MNYNPAIDGRIAPLVRTFFRYTTQEQIQTDMTEANYNGAQAINNIVENNYVALEKVVEMVWKTWTFGGKTADNFMLSQSDCVAIAVECLLTNLAPKLKTDASAGEVVTSICLWIEQKIRRAIMTEKAHGEGLFIYKNRNSEDLEEDSENQKNSTNKDDDVKDYIKVVRRQHPRSENDEERDINDYIDRLMHRHTFSFNNKKAANTDEIFRNPGHNYHTSKSRASVEVLMSC